MFFDKLAQPAATSPMAAWRTTRPEPPLSFAEVAAASAYLDFGGVPDGPWCHMTRADTDRLQKNSVVIGVGLETKDVP